MLKLTITQKSVKENVSKDSMRPAMQHALYDAEAKAIVMTDGHTLAIVPEAGDIAENVLLPVAAFPKTAGAWTEVTVEGKELRIEEKHDRKGLIEKRIIETVDDPFPNWRAVCPWTLDDKGKPHMTPSALDVIGLNATFFERFAMLAKDLGGITRTQNYILRAAMCSQG